MYLKFRGKNIFTGKEMLGNNSVLIAKEDRTIEAIVDAEIAGDDIKNVEGIISPGFINCHCHLELSHLKNIIPKHTGMIDFVLQIMSKRQAAIEFIEEAIEQAEQEMIANAIVAVGDICNTNHTIKQKKKSKLYYHNFIEVAGFVPNGAVARFNDGLKLYNEFEENFPNQNSIVPHAPYSVSSNLFSLINKFSANKISSIHHQESEEENIFFKEKQGDFLRLYKTLGVDISFFQPQYNSSTDYFLENKPTASKNILVHNTVTTQTQVEKLNSCDIQFYYCLCVLANEYINDIAPNIKALFKLPQNIVIGTDSLASNNSLNILQELKAIQKLEPSISLVQLLQAATINGAKALNIDNKFGSFEKGKKPGIILISGDDLSAVSNIIL